MQDAKPKCLFVNPPIYDFAAYDFWLRPLGLLTVAGMLRGRAELSLYDFLDRRHPLARGKGLQDDAWGRGKFLEQRVAKPEVFRPIRRYYRRFGLPQENFEQYLQAHGPFDFVFVQTVMTYWYLGVQEVIQTVRRCCPGGRIVLGGFYATACREHALRLGADWVASGQDLGPMWDWLGLGRPEGNTPAAWELYPEPVTAAITLTRGCPYRCSYCYVPVAGGGFRPRRLNETIADFESARLAGVRHLAFYDDALLYRPNDVLYPFLDYVQRAGGGVSLHSPNAMHARLMTPETARRLVAAGMKSFYLGYESVSAEFQRQTGAKVAGEDLAGAVEALRSAGVPAGAITAYEILGHPLADVQGIEESMRFASSLGIRVMLSDFSPIPGTPDGQLCRGVVDLDEPLYHNKSAFPMLLLGPEKVDYYKNLCTALNRRNKQSGQD